eukprot:scaffold209_cov396-Prasinococcus_capsulatus_cf.AAC.15
MSPMIAAPLGPVGGQVMIADRHLLEGPIAALNQCKRPRELPGRCARVVASPRRHGGLPVRAGQGQRCRSTDRSLARILDRSRPSRAVRIRPLCCDLLVGQAPRGARSLMLPQAAARLAAAARA